MLGINLKSVYDFSMRPLWARENESKFLFVYLKANKTGFYKEYLNAFDL